MEIKLELSDEQLRNVCGDLTDFISNMDDKVKSALKKEIINALIAKKESWTGYGATTILGYSNDNKVNLTPFGEILSKEFLAPKLNEIAEKYLTEDIVAEITSVVKENVIKQFSKMYTERLSELLVLDKNHIVQEVLHQIRR
jgi:hypothetical protein